MNRLFLIAVVGMTLSVSSVQAQTLEVVGNIEGKSFSSTITNGTIEAGLLFEDSFKRVGVIAKATLIDLGYVQSYCGISATREYKKPDKTGYYDAWRNKMYYEHDQYSVGTSCNIHAGLKIFPKKDGIFGANIEMIKTKFNDKPDLHLGFIVRFK